MHLLILNLAILTGPIPIALGFSRAASIAARAVEDLTVGGGLMLRFHCVALAGERGSGVG